MKRLLKPEDGEWSITRISLAILFAFIFSVGLRYIWVDHFQNTESFKWLGELMINTNDGYYYAEGARDILNGVTEYSSLESSPVNHPASQLTALIAKLLPFSFETIILWMPAFLGSLLVVPLILIGQSLRQPMMGLIAGVVGAVTWSYYNRTMVGYYDTDMLSVVLPTAVLWGIISALMYKENRVLLIAPVFLIIYLLWYPQGLSLSLAMTGMLLIYTLIFELRDSFNYKLLTLLFLALLPIDAYLKLLFIFAYFGVIFYIENRQHYGKIDYDKEEVPLDKNSFNIDKYLIFVFVAIGVALLFSGALDAILNQLKGYVFRESSATLDTETLSLKFYSVVQTVREASAIPWETFVNRISGHQVTFWVASLGVVLMMWRYRVLLIALPMLALGFLAYKNGLRFTVYAVPIYALGLGYIITIIVKDFQNRYLKYGAAIVLTSATLYPNYLHIDQYRVPVVFNKNEVAVLDELKMMAKREDYVLAWWDYGYPIRYYSDVRTFADGGKHSGSRNYHVSYSLMKSPLESANMARLMVEAHEQNKASISPVMEELGYKDSDRFLADIKSNSIALPEKTQDVYYYLPLRMLNIFPTVGLFSQIDLKSGNQAIRPFFYQSNNFKDIGAEIQLGQSISFDKRRAVIKIGKVEKPIDSFYITKYDKNGKLQVTRLQSRAGANMSIIYMQDYNKILVVDNYTLNSTYIQLFVLETYSKELFEPVIMTPIAKVFKVKK
jgi:dolichyl-diphosphooligosaccharide--protein glycosyltransferase/undecaprenyl-diphosphooligosaccharide--protein glycosyltransferase